MADESGEVVPFKAKRKGGSKEGLSAGAVTGLNLQEAGSAEVVEIANINVDPAYQRDLRHDLVNKIGRGYDIVKAGPVLVSEREDSTLWMVDGQHRMAGAQQAGETELFAHVVHGLTQAQEAELRLARNDRKSDTQQEKWRSRLVMGDPKAEAITELVLQYGTEINLSPVGTHGINAIATLELLWDIDNTGVWLGRVLKVIDDAFNDPERGAVPVDASEHGSMINPDNASASMLKAICWFLTKHVDSREAGYEEFVTRLAQFGVEDVRRKAVSHRAVNGGALWLNYYRGIVEVYNFRRSDAKKLKWKTIGSISQLGAAGTSRGSWDANRDKVGGSNR
jgi:hypothetical protein